MQRDVQRSDLARARKGKGSVKEINSEGGLRAEAVGACDGVRGICLRKSARPAGGKCGADLGVLGRCSRHARPRAGQCGCGDVRSDGVRRGREIQLASEGWRRRARCS